MFFFWTETKGLRQKKQDIFQKSDWKHRKIAHVFEDHAWKNKAQNDETQEKHGFFQNDKKRIYDMFWNFCPKTKRQFV